MPTFEKPGITTARETEERQILASSRGNVESMLMDMPVVIRSSAADAGNTPTTTLRAGLIMAIGSDGKAFQYTANATDGTQNAVGILPESVSMLDLTATAVDKAARLFVNGPFRESELILLDDASRSALGSIGIKFVSANAYSRIDGSQSLVHQAATEPVATSPEVLVTSDNGKLFVATAAMTFTIPAIVPGLAFEFVQSANANMIISSAVANIIGPNGSAFKTITFSTTAGKIGAYVRIRSIYLGSALKWLPEILSNVAINVPVFAT